LVVTGPAVTYILYMGNKIHIIPAQQLDKARWDACIAQSHNGLVYATSAYLDAMATHWHAMVLNDYEYIMPLPWRKKYFTRYVYPPAFIQQLGIFSANVITAETTALFINSVPAVYKYCSLHFNYANPVQYNHAKSCKNYLLPLSPGYNTLRNAYSRSAIRNVNKAQNAGITIQENINPAEVINIHRQRFNDAIGATGADYDNFLQLCNTFLQTGQCFTVGAYSNDALIAGSVYFIFNNRITFILNGNTADSLTNGATHLLKDHTIKKFAGSNFILDFEGSDFESFARFYQQFGANQIEYYTTLVINRLPALFRILKR